jgi:hypothetical protein
MFRLSGKMIQANIMNSEMILAKMKNVSQKLYPVSEKITYPKMGPSMQPSPLAVEQKPKYSIFCLGKRMVMALYPAIERVASPIPSKALRANAMPENQSLNALNN